MNNHKSADQLAEELGKQIGIILEQHAGLREAMASEVEVLDVKARFALASKCQPDTMTEVDKTPMSLQAFTDDLEIDFKGVIPVPMSPKTVEVKSFEDIGGVLAEILEHGEKAVKLYNETTAQTFLVQLAQLANDIAGLMQPIQDALAGVSVADMEAGLEEINKHCNQVMRMADKLDLDASLRFCVNGRPEVMKGNIYTFAGRDYTDLSEWVNAFHKSFHYFLAGAEFDLTIDELADHYVIHVGRTWDVTVPKKGVHVAMAAEIHRFILSMFSLDRSLVCSRSRPVYNSGECRTVTLTGSTRGKNMAQCIR